MKYTDEQLKAMALSCFHYRSTQPNLYREFLYYMSMYSRKSPADVEFELIKFANMNTEAN
jgi:hypothetical protein